MTGWRIGFIAAPLWIAKACNKLQGQYTSGASSIAQKAAAAAFAGEQGCVETMRQAFQHRRDLVVRLAKEIPGLKVNDPQGAFYLFPEVSHYLGKSDVYPRSRSCRNGGGRCFRGSRLSSSVLCHFRGEYHRSHAPYERSPRPFEVRPAESGSVEK